MGTGRPEADIGLEWGWVGWGGSPKIVSMFIVLALTNSETLTLFVSEPDFRNPRLFSLRNVFG